MATTEDLKRYRMNWQNEMDAAALYRVMAESESKIALADIYRKLALVEEKHARFWDTELKKSAVTLAPWQPGARLRILRWLAGRLGPQVVLPMIAATEHEGRADYDDQPETQGSTLSMDERSHARVLAEMVRSSSGMDGGSIGRLEGRHRSLGGNALRAAVLGANDGLVSNLSLVMGVAGAHLADQSILVTGIAGLLAGACSMAIGEWVSVQSSRELNERQIAIEADELNASPEEEKEELTLIYQAKGIPETEARALAEHLFKDKAKALDTLAREELGIDPKELGGSAWTAAFTSFLLFAGGAIIPLAPFFILHGLQAVYASVLCSALGLFGIGAGITLVTARSPLKTGLRQLLMGLAAAAVTYGIGHLLGVSLAG
jgi:VIT1/CCC1 family predicted Fe2+/Mn2+ transporter